MTPQNDACPLENDGESLVMVIGGETVVSRENEHSTSVEILGPNGLCKVRKCFPMDELIWLWQSG